MSNSAAQLRQALLQVQRRLHETTDEDFGEDIVGGHTEPYVLATADSKSLHFSFETIQSRMDRLRPEVLTLAYTRTMMGFLLFNAQPSAVAMIGLGGGSLARFIHHHFPRTLLKVVEINPSVVDMRHEFLIPADGERFKVRVGDGAEFVRRPPRQFDTLLVDGFDVRGQPPELASAAFYRNCSKCLTHDGVLVVNLCPAYPGYARQVADIRHVFKGNAMAVYDDECSNTIMLASHASLRKLFVRHGWRCKRLLPAQAYSELRNEFRQVASSLRRFLLTGGELGSSETVVSEPTVPSRDA